MRSRGHLAPPTSSTSPFLVGEHVKFDHNKGFRGEVAKVLEWHWVECLVLALVAADVVLVAIEAGVDSRLICIDGQVQEAVRHMRGSLHADTGMLVCEGPESHKVEHIVHVCHLASVSILFTFCMELLLKWWAIPGFTKAAMHRLDMIVVFLSFLIDTAVIWFIEHHRTSGSVQKDRERIDYLMILLIFCRVWRIVRIAHGFAEFKELSEEARVKGLVEKCEELQAEVQQLEHHADVGASGSPREAVAVSTDEHNRTLAAGRAGIAISSGQNRVMLEEYEQFCFASAVYVCNDAAAVEQVKTRLKSKEDFVIAFEDGDSFGAYGVSFLERPEGYRGSHTVSVFAQALASRSILQKSGLSVTHAKWIARQTAQEELNKLGAKSNAPLVMTDVEMEGLMRLLTSVA